MSRDVTFPYLPSPPGSYSPTYMAQVVRALSVFALQFQTPGAIYGTTLSLSRLPADDAGLRVGDIFESGGFVKVSRAHNPHPRAGIMAVGTGVVTTT